MLQLPSVEPGAREGIVSPGAQVGQMQLGHGGCGFLDARMDPFLDHPAGAVGCCPERTDSKGVKP